MEIKHGINSCSQESVDSCLTVDKRKCNKCGICINMCPMDVLRFNRQGYPYMQYEDDCWYCDTCAFMCPRQAISLELPYLIR